MAKKFDAQFPFRLPRESKDALERIAVAKAVDAQELLRRAAYAIVAYAEINGAKRVPLDMEIVPHNAPSETHIKIAEEIYKKLKSDERKKQNP